MVYSIHGIKYEACDCLGFDNWYMYMVNGTSCMACVCSASIFCTDCNIYYLWAKVM